MKGMDATHNRRLVRKFFSVYYKNAEELRSICHPKVKLHFRNALLANGVEELIELAKQEQDCFHELAFDIQQILTEKYAASARVIQRGIQHKKWHGIEPRGLPFDIEQMMFFDIEARQISHIWPMWDLELKLTQLS